MALDFFTGCLQLWFNAPDYCASFSVYDLFALVANLCVLQARKTKHKSQMQHTRGNLHFVRKQRRMSQRQVAYLIGHRDATMLSKYERSILAPSLRTALKLSLLYRLPVREIFIEESSYAQDELMKKVKTLPVTQAVLF